jgi:hypothetical protein
MQGKLALLEVIPAGNPPRNGLDSPTTTIEKAKLKSGAADPPVVLFPHIISLHE